MPKADVQWVQSFARYKLPRSDLLSTVRLTSDLQVCECSGICMAWDQGGDHHNYHSRSTPTIDATTYAFP